MKVLKKILKVIFSLTIFIIVSLILILTYSKHIEPKLITTKNYDIKSEEDIKSKDIKVVQFTDVHLGEFYSLSQLEKVVEKINNQNADIVVFTGDLIDKAGQYKDINKVSSVLEKINANIGKYAVWGNHDYGGGGHAYYEDIMTESGFTILKNEIVTIPIDKNKNMTISGLDEAMLGNPDYNSIINNINDKDFNLLLLHEPDLVNEFVNSDINLALAGHSHGGQVALPFIGAIVKPAIGEIYTKGFYKIGGNKKFDIYVNSGIGNTRLAYRFMNIPEITVFDINV